jgi:hypothetical protein
MGHRRVRTVGFVVGPLTTLVAAQSLIADGYRDGEAAQDRVVRLFLVSADYDYAAFKKVADEVGALTIADISHIGGLVAANVMRNTFDSGFDVVTTATHKTSRGPRGGRILSKAAYAKKIDSSARVSRAARI